jgi:hypothetical protein
MVSMKIIMNSFLKTEITDALEGVKVTCCGLETQMWMWKGTVNWHQSSSKDNNSDNQGHYVIGNSRPVATKNKCYEYIVYYSW